MIGLSDPLRAPVEPALPRSFADEAMPRELIDAELEARSLDGVDWAGRDARGLRLAESEVRSSDLTGASLARTRFIDVVVTDGSWANISAVDAAFSRVRFEGVRLTGADLSGSRLDNVTFSACRLDLCSFRFANLEIVRFEGCRLGEVDLYEAQLDSVSFTECDLTGATLTGATFSDSELRGCDLTSARGPERLRGVRMPWIDVMRSARELAAGVGIEVIDD